jgi:uncharacterized protein YggE
MKIKGVIAIIGLAAFLVLGAACSNGEAASDPGTSPEPSPPSAPAAPASSQTAPAADAPGQALQVLPAAGEQPPLPALGSPEPSISEVRPLSGPQVAVAVAPQVEPEPAAAGREGAAPSVAVAPLPPALSVNSSAGRSALAGYSGSLLLQAGSSQAGIWVTGEGTITLEPDLAVVNIGVETEAQTVAEARDRAATAMAGIVNAVKAYGLTDKDVQTRSFNIYPVYEYPEVVEFGRTTRKQVLTGYRVSNSASIKIRDLDKVGDIIDDVATAGGDATRINGISFTVEDTKPFMTGLREAAVRDAIAKAEQFASLTGVSVGRLVFISESGGRAPVVQDFGVERSFAVAAQAAPATSISGGELELRLGVQVVFDIQ